MAKLSSKIVVRFYEETDGPCVGSEYVEIEGCASVDDLGLAKRAISDLIERIHEGEVK